MACKFEVGRTYKAFYKETNYESWITIQSRDQKRIKFLFGSNYKASSVANIPLFYMCEIDGTEVIEFYSKSDKIVTVKACDVI